MTKLFISYAHLDSGTVLNISRQLKEAGYELWIDKLGIQGGDLWVSEIVKGIRGCDIFLLFVSSNSVRSEYVRRELDVAFGEKRKIIHVMIENVEIPESWVYQLAGLQYVDYRNPDWKSQLLEALGGEHPQPASPVRTTGKLNNPYSSLPVLELIERALVFSNREDELQRGIQQLKDHRVLLVTGMPGIGKSTFARALLDSIPADSPEPFWYSFYRHRTSGNTLGVLLDRLSGHLEVCLGQEVRRDVLSFRDSPSGTASVNDVDALIGFLNQDTPIWLVFDNMETVLSHETNGFLDEGLELLFDSLKNNTHNAKIIITNPFVPDLRSGEPFLEAGTEAITLKGLDDASSIAFLRAFGVQNISDSDLVQLLVEINGHPFMLNNIAHDIKTLGTSTPEALKGGLDEMIQRYGETLKQHLSSQEFTTLQSMTTLNREISLSGLCQIAQVRHGVVVRLREIGLLQINNAGEYWLHNIVRNSIRLTDPEKLKENHLRAMNFFRSQTVPSLPQSVEEYANVFEWYHHAIQAHDLKNAYTALYSSGLEAQLTSWNEFDLLTKLCEQILEAASRQTNILSHVEQARIHRTLGTLYFYSGDFTQSITYLKTAVDLLQVGENQELRIALLIELSESYNGNRDFSIAMNVCNQAVNELSALSNEGLKARVIHLRGIINRDRGNLEQALSDIKEALDLYTRLMDHTHIANATVDLGVIHYQNNQFDEAVLIYQKVITLCDSIKDLRGVMIAHYNIGDIYLQGGKISPAFIEFQKALEIARQKKFGWMEVLAGLAFVETRLDLLELDAAQDELKILDPLIRKHESPCSLGNEFALYARLYWKHGQIESARDYFRRALGKLEFADCQELKARTYLAYSGFLKEQGYDVQAKDALMKGKGIFAEINNELGLKAAEAAMTGLENVG